MTGLRFKVGELAIMALCPSRDGDRAIGQTVEVIAISVAPGQPVKASWGEWYFCRTGHDYVVQFPNDSLMWCSDWQLRKIDPPAEPASLKRESEVVA